ncbi:MAG TPA: CocE/NonD family hydrolase [Polyangiales bacterium]|nr:CocE/NonD family hydrolase [Polyangiales bacterium]
MATPREPDNAIEVFPLPQDIRAERDVAVTMPDGTRLSANVFLPEATGALPVVLALTPYDKDVDVRELAERSIVRRKKIGLGMGRYKISDSTPFEAPDPAYWVRAGYAVVHVDLRGRGKSQGKAKPYSRTEIQDYYHIVEWAGSQPWSNGRVALHGVSYLAIVQWYVAAAPPPQLVAIVPWEGNSDRYRDVMFHGGVPETAFFRGWQRNMDPESVQESPAEGPSRTPPISEVRGNPARLEQIQVPALICGSYSDQGLHTKGCFDAFKRIGSQHKFLYTHGRGKWTVYYSEDALAYQRRFLDHFLKGADNGMDREPPVRLEVRRTIDSYDVRAESDWPLPRTQYRKAALDAATRTLSFDAPRTESRLDYDSNAERGASFELKFDRATELTGHMKLALSVSTDAGDDLDLLVGIEKLDASGDVVHFEGRENDTHGLVSNGWLRVSHRELDPARSMPWQPVLKHERVQLVKPGEIVTVEIEILPSSTRFEAGEGLRLLISGKDVFSNAMHHHRETCNAGRHTIYTGGKYDSHLLLPVIPD